MLMHALIDGIKGSTLDGKEEIGTRIICELKIHGISGNSFPPKSHCCSTILTLAPTRIDILIGIDLRHHMIS